MTPPTRKAGDGIDLLRLADEIDAQLVTLYGDGSGLEKKTDRDEYRNLVALALRVEEALQKRNEGGAPDTPKPPSMKRGGQATGGGRRPKPTRPDPAGSPSVELGGRRRDG